MAEACIRGSIFRSAIEELQRERDAGRVDPDALESELAPEDLRLLDEKILDGEWYPMASYARMLDLLCRSVAGGSRVYFAERGARNAQRLMDAGAYAQLDLLQRFTEGGVPERIDDPEAMAEAEKLFKERLAVVVSLAGAIYSAGDWQVVDDPEAPERACIEIHDADAYSEGMRLAMEGFLNQCVRSVPGTGLTRLFRSERLEPDHIRIRMTLDLSTVLASLAEEGGVGGSGSTG